MRTKAIQELTKLPNGFYNRGDSMDRLETFVAAAFAFAVTTLIISVGKIPNNHAEFLQAIKLIPSFAASFAIIIWIWATHANWCRRYGLEDGKAIVLSAILVFLVLVYILPLRIIMQSFFSAISDGYLPSDMHYEDGSQLRFMFAFYAIGFFALAVNFIGLFTYALSVKKSIDLTHWEISQTKTEVQAWMLAAFIAVLAFVFSLFLPIDMIDYSGYVYFLLIPVLGFHGWLRKRHA